MLFDEEDKFTQYYKSNNKLIGSISISNLKNIKILIPNEQRIRDDDKVKEIVEYQDSYYKRGKNSFNFIGVINIHSCKEDGKNYLVDGQHRWKAIMALCETHKYKDFNVNIEVIKVETKEELIENYNIINKNTELPEFPEEIDKNIPETVAKYFFKEYPEMWTLKTRAIRPKLNKNQFQMALGFLTIKLNNSLDIETDVEDLKKIIIEKNDKMSKWPIDSYIQNIRKIKNWSKYKSVCDEHGLYLGMYNFTNEEYGYEWTKDIIRDLTGEIIKKQKKKKKKTIPKNKRRLVWSENNGNKNRAKCYSCGIVELDYQGSWECGHVISENDGGTLDVNNLKPICSNCNKTMGTKNMNDFIKECYPERHNKLNNTGWFGNFFNH